MIRRLLKLRKQNDCVKIIFIMVFLACVCIGSAINSGMKMYKYINTPIEYSFCLNNVHEGVKADIEGLYKLDDVLAVSEEANMGVTFVGNEKSETFNVIYISEEYMERAFGIEAATAMQTFYTNSDNFIKIRALYNSVFDTNEDDTEDLSLIQCRIADDDKKKQVQLIELDSILEEQPVLYCIKDSQFLMKERSGIRIYFSKKDIDGKHKLEVENAGYTLENELAYDCNVYEIRILWSKIREKIIAGIALVIFSILLYKYGVKK